MLFLVVCRRENSGEQTGGGDIVVAPGSNETGLDKSEVSSFDVERFFPLSRRWRY